MLLSSLRTDGDFCNQGRDTEIVFKNVRLSKLADMAIHWNVLEEHFLMVQLVFRFTHFRGGGGMHFLNFSSKNLKGVNLTVVVQQHKSSSSDRTKVCLVGCALKTTAAKITLDMFTIENLPRHFRL
jgi:hypothetical protein